MHQSRGNPSFYAVKKIGGVRALATTKHIEVLQLHLPLIIYFLLFSYDCINMPRPLSIRYFYDFTNASNRMIQFITADCER
jgi:hypothetical protein